MNVEQEDAVAVLALEDGAVFYGRAFGAVGALKSGRCGDVIFNTAMTGYQEVCTDPSYRGQMVVMTYPLVGNYGVNADDAESRRPWLSALLVREYCADYSHWRAEESLGSYLARFGIPGVCELDTRALTRHLRTTGTLRGVVRAFPAATAIDIAVLVQEAEAIHTASQLNPLPGVALPAIQPWVPWRSWDIQPVRQAIHAAPDSGARPRIVLIDSGYKESIACCLAAHALEVVLAPYDTPISKLLALRPDGVVLANGPGDPSGASSLVALVRELLALPIPMPVMGICLGHQIIGLAAGAQSTRLPFGHHGANHPVIELRTGKVTVTSQNHLFQIIAATLPANSGFRVSHISVLDGSIEGLEHQTLPVFSLQFHPEAGPGPEDNREYFNRFVNSVMAHQAALVA